MKYLIIGQGRIGQEVAIMLAKSGHVITALARSAKVYPDDVMVDFWQKNALDLTKDEINDFDGIAIIITPDGGADRVKAYQDSYLAVCQHMANLDVDCQKVLFVSSTSVYGENEGQIVDEHTTARPTAPTAKMLLDAENALIRTYGRRAIIVRPSGIYGSSTRMTERAKRSHADGVPSHHYTNRIHEQDLTAVIARILMADDFKHVYLVSDFESVTLADVVSFICQNQGFLPPKIIPSTPTGKRVMPNIDKIWLRFHSYQDGYV